MADLRQRVEKAIDDHDGLTFDARSGRWVGVCDGCGEWKVHAMPEATEANVELMHLAHRADAILSVFVEELRERADAMRVVGDGNRAAELVAKWLDETADEIAPKP